MAHNVHLPTAAVVVRNPLLRNLVREDLERSGFAVIAVSASDDGSGADVVVSDRRDVIGGLDATVLINGAIEFLLPGRSVVYPISAVGSIPDILRRETQRKAS
jgi:hypothetical protein